MFTFSASCGHCGLSSIIAMNELGGRISYYTQRLFIKWCNDNDNSLAMSFGGIALTHVKYAWSSPYSTAWQTASMHFFIASLMLSSVLHSALHVRCGIIMGASELLNKTYFPIHFPSLWQLDPHPSQTCERKLHQYMNIWFSEYKDDVILQYLNQR